MSSRIGCGLIKPITGRLFSAQVLRPAISPFIAKKTLKCFNFKQVWLPFYSIVDNNKQADKALIYAGTVTFKENLTKVIFSDTSPDFNDCIHKIDTDIVINNNVEMLPEELLYKVNKKSIHYLENNYYEFRMIPFKLSPKESIQQLLQEKQFKTLVGEEKMDLVAEQYYVPVFTNTQMTKFVNGLNGAVFRATPIIKKSDTFIKQYIITFIETFRDKPITTGLYIISIGFILWAITNCIFGVLVYIRFYGL